MLVSIVHPRNSSRLSRSSFIGIAHGSGTGQAARRVAGGQREFKDKGVLKRQARTRSP